MGTEDELKRCGQAAVALMGVAAARAKQVAEQLLGSRENAKEDAKHRAGTLVDEGRRAAADVVSALRKEASVLFKDLEHLEEHLRGGTAGGGAPAAGESAGRAPRASAGKTTAAKRTSGARKTVGATTAEASGVRKSAATKAARAGQSAAPQKAAVAGKKATVAKAPAAKAPAAKASAVRKAGRASPAAGARSGTSSRGRA